MRGKYHALKGKHQVLKGKYQVLKGKYQVLRGKYQVLRGKYQVLRGKYQVLKGKFKVLIETDPHIFADLDPGSQNVTDQDPKHCNCFEQRCKPDISGWFSCGKCEQNILWPVEGR